MRSAPAARGPSRGPSGPPRLTPTVICVRRRIGSEACAQCVTRPGAGGGTGGQPPDRRARVDNAAHRAAGPRRGAHPQKSSARPGSSTHPVASSRDAALASLFAVSQLASSPRAQRGSSAPPRPPTAGARGACAAGVLRGPSRDAAKRAAPSRSASALFARRSPLPPSPLRRTGRWRSFLAERAEATRRMQLGFARPRAAMWRMGELRAGRRREAASTDGRDPGRP